MNRLILLVESRIRGDVYVRFGGELPKTHRSNTAGRWMLSLPLKSVNNLVKDARKVQQTILMVGDITDIYVNSFQRMLRDRNFRPEELSAIAFRLHETAGREQRSIDGTEERGEHHHALHDRQGAHGRGGTLPLEDEALPQPRELLHEQEHLRELPACEKRRTTSTASWGCTGT